MALGYAVRRIEGEEGINESEEECDDDPCDG